MANQTYKIPRVTDEQIAAHLTSLSQEFGQLQVGIQALTHGVGQIAFPDSDNAVWLKLLELKSDLIDHFGCQISGVSLHYYRGGYQGDHTQKSPVFDDLVLDTQGADPARLAIAARIVALFRPIQLPRPTDQNDLVAAQRAIQESTFARLEHQLEQLFQQTVDVRAQLDKAVHEKEVALESAFAKRIEGADAAIAAKRAELAKEQDQLESRRKELDDSDNTFARRQIRDRLLADVADRVTNFGVSEATQQARKPVVQGMIALISLLALLLFWTAVELFQLRELQAQPRLTGVAQLASAPATGATAQSVLTGLTGEKIALWARLSLLTIGLVAAIVYYIRWQSLWAAQFANTEQSLRQFHIDVNRANWVVETGLEWQKETSTDLPTPLVESLTRGLFAEREPATQVLHPADELASALLGSASKLSLDVAGSKVEIDKPGKIPKSVPSAGKQSTV